MILRLHLPAVTIQEDSYFLLQKEVEAVLCDTFVWDNVSTSMHWYFPTVECKFYNLTV